MMETQYIRLNMVPSGIIPIFNISQYDVGRKLGFYVHIGAIPVNLDNYTCTIEATRKDGVAIITPVETSNNVGTFEVTATMSNIVNRYLCQLVLVNENSKRVASLPFYMNVIKAAMDENAEAIEEDATLYQQYTDAMQSIIAETKADIVDEATERQANIDAEIAARQSADNALRLNIYAEESEREQADNTLNARIDNLIAPSGEAPSTAEIIDARVGDNGYTYSSLGTAIRSQINILKRAINNAENKTGLVKPTNIFDLSTITDNYIMTRTGATADNGYSYSDYIPVDGSKTYSFRGCYGNRIQIILYDGEKNYLKQLYENQVTSGSYSSGFLTVDFTALGYPQTAFVIVNMTTVSSTTYMFVEGTEYPAEYLEYNEYTPLKSAWVVEAVKMVIKEAFASNWAIEAIKVVAQQAINLILHVGDIVTIASREQQTISLGEDAVNDDSLASIAIGTGALKNATHTQNDEGYFNIALGHGAMETATTSDHCTAVGYQAMKSVQTGKYNSAFGEDALMSNADGNRNVAVGCRALQSQTTGDDNVAIGALAAYSTDQTKRPTGSKNTYIGAYAGQIDNNGSNNIAIGYYAGRTSSAFSNTISIGHMATPTKNNQMILGSNVIDECKIYGNTLCFRRNTDGKILELIFDSDGTVKWQEQS